MSNARRKRSFLSRHPRAKRVAYTLYGLALIPLLVLVFPLRLLPKRASYWLGSLVARLCLYPIVRIRIDTNLRFAYGARMTPRRCRAIGIKVATNVVWSVIDCYYLWVWWWMFDINKVVVRTVNCDVVAHALSAGTGAIIATGHYQCFEVMPVYFRKVMGAKGGVVPRSFPSPFLNWLYRRVRLLYDVPSFYDEVKGVIKALRANGIVGILPDLHARKRLAVPATFYGKPTLTFDIHVRLASQTGCPIVPAFLMRHKRVPWQYTLVACAPHSIPRKADAATISAHVQALNDSFEHHFRRFPSGWIWFHNKWALW